MPASVADSGVDPQRLQDELAATRKRGYSVSRNELISGAVAIAVPFFDRTGEVAGSIGVFGPEVRLDASRQKEVAQLLLQESQVLSEALGHSGARG